ncbi:MAG: hypothetical protein RSA79_07545 [Oscillospiraceae bacterium]
MKTNMKSKSAKRILIIAIILIVLAAIITVFAFFKYKEKYQIPAGGSSPLNWGTKEPKLKQTAKIDLYDFLPLEKDDAIKKLNGANVFFKEEDASEYVGENEPNTLGESHYKQFQSNKMDITFCSNESGDTNKIRYATAYYKYTNKKTDISVLGINGKTKKKDAINILKKYGKVYSGVIARNPEDYVQAIVDDKYKVFLRFEKNKLVENSCGIADKRDFAERDKAEAL